MFLVTKNSFKEGWGGEDFLVIKTKTIKMVNDSGYNTRSSKEIQWLKMVLSPSPLIIKIFFVNE